MHEPVENGFALLSWFWTHEQRKKKTFIVTALIHDDVDFCLSFTDIPILGTNPVYRTPKRHLYFFPRCIPITLEPEENSTTGKPEGSSVV